MDTMGDFETPYGSINTIRDTFRVMSSLTKSKFEFKTKELNKYFDWWIPEVTVIFNNGKYIFEVTENEQPYYIRGEELFGMVMNRIMNYNQITVPKDVFMKKAVLNPNYLK